MDHRTGTRQHTIALLLLAAVVAGFWLHRVQIEQPTRYGEGAGDLTTYFYPLATHMHRELRNGKLPLWNPYQLAGVPLVAGPLPATFYPPNLLTLRFLHPAHAIEAQLLLHLFVAGFGTWLFTRRLGLCASACLAASLGYMLAGQGLRWQYNPAHLATLAWLPVVLWAVHGTFTAQLRRAVVLALALAAAFLAGWAQGFVFELQLALAYGLLGVLVWVPRGRRLRAIGVACAAAPLFLGLVAAQLLPALELVTSGTRALSGVLPQQANVGALAPAELLRGILGLPPQGSPLLMNHWIPWRQGSAALLTLPLVALGLADRARRAHWLFFLTAALLTALFMLGLQAPVFRLYLALPLGDAFRIPSRAGFVYGFALAVLLGIGVQGARTLLLRWRRTTPLAPVAAGLLALGVGADLYARSAPPFTRPVLQGDALDAPRDLVDSLRERAGDDRIYVFRVRARSDPRSVWLHPKLGMANELFVVPDYEPLLPGNYRRFLAHAHSGLWRGVPDWQSAVHRGGTTAGLERLLDLMSVRYYLYDPPVTGVPASTLRRLGRELPRLGELHLRERDSALPRTYLVHEVLVEPDPERLVARLLAPGFDPRRAVIASEPLGPLAPTLRDAREGSELRGYAPNEATVSASCASACLLVLTDLAYPGWTVRVDGVLAPIHTVNLLFRGVRLEPGPHEVVFRYESVRLRAGVWLSASSLAGVAVLALITGARRRREAQG